MGTRVELTDGSFAEKVITVGLDGQVPAAEASTSTAGNQTSVQAPVAPATATATKSELAGTISHTTSASRTDGQQSAMEADLKGNLKTVAYVPDSTTAMAFGAGAVAAGVQRTTLASDDPAVASLALLTPTTAAGAALTPVVLSALATSKVIKASAGNLYGINCMATTVAGIFLIHNAAAAPAAGAVTPIKAYPVGIGQGVEVSFNPPLRFATGISITFTSATTPFTQTDSATAFIEGDAV